MRIRPPPREILRPPHPGLVHRAIGNRRPRLAIARRSRRVIPLIRLTCAKPRLEIGPVINRSRTARIKMQRPVPPVGDRPIGIDPHRINRRRRPERIKRKPHLASARRMRAIFRPVRGISQLRPRTEHGFHIACQTGQRRSRRIDSRPTPDPRNPDQFRSDDERIHPARHCGQFCIMQDHPPPAPLRWPRIDHRILTHLKMARLRRPEKRRNLRRRRRCPVGRPGLPRCRMARNPPPPGIGLLPVQTGPRIRQRIARRNIHHRERIERHLEPARLQIGNRLQNRRVGRRPAIGRLAVTQRDHLRHPPLDPANAPCGAVRRFLGRFHPRLDPASPRPQIIPEPAHHQRHRLERRTQRRQLRNRRLPITRCHKLMPVLAHGRTRPVRTRHARRLVDKLPRPRDHIDRPDSLPHAVDRPHHLEGQLRNPVAIGFQRKSLEHHISHTAIGRRRLRPLLRHNQRVRLLRLVARVNPDRERRQVQQRPVRPNPPHIGDRPFRNRNREIRGIFIGPRRHARPAEPALAAAFLSRDHRFLKPRRPDDLAAKPHPPVNPRNRRALGRGQPRHFRQARPLPRPLARKHGAVHHIPRKPAKRTPEHRAHRPADKSANRRSRRLQYQSCHRLTSSLQPGNLNTCAIFRAHSPSGTSATEARSCACTMASASVRMPRCFAGRCACHRNSSRSPGAIKSREISSKCRRDASLNASAPAASAHPA